MTINTYQPGPYEAGPQGNDTVPEGCGTIVLDGALLLLGGIVAAVLWIGVRLCA